MAKTELFVRKQPGGMFAVVNERMTTGNIWFVYSGTGSDATGYGYNPDAPFATVDYAIGKCTASQNDTIYVMPGHAETVTAAVTVDIAGISIIGIGNGRNRPALTVSGAIDLITVTAANAYIENLRLIGAAANATALVNIAAADLEMANMVFEPAETPVTTITVASGGHRFHLHDFKCIASANGPDYFMDFESSASDNWIVERGFINFTPNGLDHAVFRANVDTTAGGVIKDVVAIGLDADVFFVDFNSSSAVGEGLIVNCHWQNNAASTIAATVDLGGYGIHMSGATDGPVRHTVLIPATSAS